MSSIVLSTTNRKYLQKKKFCYFYEKLCLFNQKLINVHYDKIKIINNIIGFENNEIYKLTNYKLISNYIKNIKIDKYTSSRFDLDQMLCNFEKE